MYSIIFIEIHIYNIIKHQKTLINIPKLSYIFIHNSLRYICTNCITIYYCYVTCKNKYITNDIL